MSVKSREKEIRLKRRKAHPIQVDIDGVPRLKAALAKKPVKKPTTKKPVKKVTKSISKDASEWSPLLAQNEPEVKQPLPTQPVEKKSWWWQLGFDIGSLWRSICKKLV